MTIDRRTKYIPTDVSVPASCWDQSSQRILDNFPSALILQLKIDTIIVEWLKRIDKMKVLGERITIHSLFDNSERKQPKSAYTIESFFEKQIRNMKEIGKIGTATKYRYCLALLKKAGPVNIGFEEIDLDYLRSFEKFLVKKGNKGNSIATKFSVFRAVYNKAANEGIFFIERDPFKAMKIGGFL